MAAEMNWSVEYEPIAGEPERVTCRLLLNGRQVGAWVIWDTEDDRRDAYNDAQLVIGRYEVRGERF